MTERQRLFVIDTSSVIKIRELVPKVHLVAVFHELDRLVELGVLVYPVEVVKELERYFDPDASNPDPPCHWAQRNSHRATRHGPQFDRLKEILRHPQIRRVVDPDKFGVEEADPYVLALAVHLKDEGEVTVLNEERRDRPTKLSITTACGLLRLLALPIDAFLADHGIWPH